MKTKFIAEVGSNHNQDLNRCFAFIEKAKALGCWGIKFQSFKADMLWTKAETVAKMSHWELPASFIPSIYKYCKDVKIKIGFSVFNTGSVTWLNNYTDFFKIGSYEIRCIDMIKQCYSTKKPLFISAGLISWQNLYLLLEDIDSDWRKRSGNITVYHCNSHYPAKSEECDLYRIRTLKTVIAEQIGWSDHSREPGVIYQAIANGARAIEFHLDLDGKGHEYEFGHCWLPNQIRDVIHNVDIMERCEGNGVIPLDKKLLDMRTDPVTAKRNY